MSKTYLLSFETLKTFGNGALGAMTFGAYHQYTTNRIIDLNNEKIALQQKIQEEQHKRDMSEIMKQHAYLREHLENLKKKLETKKGVVLLK